MHPNTRPFTSVLSHTVTNSLLTDFFLIMRFGPRLNWSWGVCGPGWSDTRDPTASGNLLQLAPGNLVRQRLRKDNEIN